jgi:LacI family transcriptional regulator
MLYRPSVTSTSKGTPSPPAATTIGAVAREVGVSRSTVSRAFTRPHLLRPETVTRVLEAAERLGYEANQAARALATGHNGTIALVVPDIANPFFPPLIRAAQATADGRDYCVMLGDSAESPEQEQRLISRFTSQVDGFLLVSSRLTEADLTDQAQRRSLVLINRDVPNVPRVLLDARAGIAEAVEHLAELGHERIAYIGGPLRSWSDHQRRQSVTGACAAANIDLTILQARPATYVGGGETVEAVLESRSTGVIAFDDIVAHGVLAGLAQKGVSVPDEVSVIGCDDVFAAMTYPQLTTISMPCADAGEIAVSVLLDLVGGRRLTDVRYNLDSKLVVRATTGKAPHA